MSQATIVVPCYNEAARLDVARFEAFLVAHPGPRLLFVDDGSTDATAEVLERLRASAPGRVAVLRLPRNRGKAEAVRQGILRAAEAADVDYVGFWDADLATPLEAILDFARLLDADPGLELVIGARVKLLGHAIRRRTARHYLGRVFATAASLALRLAVYDTQCGAKLFRASPAIVGLFRQPFFTRWIFDVEILARLIADRRGTDLPPPERVVYELPLHRWEDVAGSKVRPKDFVRAFFELIQIARSYRTRSRRTVDRPDRAPATAPVIASAVEDRAR